jgi:hypothetical protein
VAPVEKRFDEQPFRSFDSDRQIRAEGHHRVAHLDQTDPIVSESAFDDTSATR